MSYRITETCPHCGRSQEWQVSVHTPLISISQCQHCRRPYAAELRWPHGYDGGRVESINQRPLTPAEMQQWQAGQRWVDSEIDRLSPGVRQRFEARQQQCTGLLARLFG